MNNKRDIDIIFSTDIDWAVFKEKTVLITGTTGRLGMYLVGALLEANKRWSLNTQVIGLARSENKAKKVFGDMLANNNLHMIYQDITEPICIDEPVDYICHTAGQASPSDYATPVDTLWGHVKGTRNVLECARLHNSEKVLYISTVEVYGTWQENGLIKETDLGPLAHANARACYPEAKRLCETMLASYKKQYGIDFVCVRMSHTLGPGIALNDGRGFAEFIQDALDKKDIVLHSDGSAVRTYTYVADAVGAMFLVLSKGEAEFYNVANIENKLSIRDLAQLIAELSPNPIEVCYDSSVKPTLSYLPYTIGIVDTASIKELGWKPIVGVRDTLKWTIDSFL